MLPLYFVPNANAVTAELLASHALGNLLGASTHSQHTFSGPGGQTGLLIADNSLPLERFVFDAERQRWSKRFGFTSMIGTWIDSPPTPAELAKSEQLKGIDIALLDSQHWHVPILRAWRQTDSLQFDVRVPRVLQQCAETGAWLLTAVLPQYRELWESSLKIADALFDQLRNGDNTAELEWDDVFNFAVQVLAANYRVDASVLSHLQVLEPSLAAEVTRCALDWHTLRATLKNVLSRLSGGTNTESGATPPIVD